MFIKNNQFLAPKFSDLISLMSVEESKCYKNFQDQVSNLAAKRRASWKQHHVMVDIGGFKAIKQFIEIVDLNSHYSRLKFFCT